MATYRGHSANVPIDIGFLLGGPGDNVIKGFPKTPNCFMMYLQHRYKERVK